MYVHSKGLHVLSAEAGPEKWKEEKPAEEENWKKNHIVPEEETEARQWAREMWSAAE